VDLSLVTMRYWFTSDGGSTTFWTYCDYAYMGCSNLSSSVTLLGQARTGADAYFEVAFNSSAGSLNAAAWTDEIMVRFNKSDWSTFDETNDYSYAAPITTYTDSPKVTAYYYGNLLWGTEP
jgi:Cellulose binding domain